MKNRDLTQSEFHQDEERRIQRSDPRAEGYRDRQQNPDATNRHDRGSQEWELWERGALDWVTSNMPKPKQ